MTEASELFGKFKELWHAGKNARLSMECYAGQAWLSLHIHLHQQPPPQPNLFAVVKDEKQHVKVPVQLRKLWQRVNLVQTLQPYIDTAEEAGNDVTTLLSLLLIR